MTKYKNPSRRHDEVKFIFTPSFPTFLNQFNMYISLFIYTPIPKWYYQYLKHTMKLL